MTSTSHTSMSRMEWVYDGTIDYIGLEQFATSIAALANHETAPLSILETVLASIAENMNAASGEATHNAETVLRERAQRLGFNDISVFVKEVTNRISDCLVELQVSKLSAQYRSLRSAQ